MTTATTYEVHPLAELIPAMSDAEYRELREDIESNGLRQSITLYEGKVLDGRHRARACGELGVEPGTTDYAGDSPAAFVWSLNGVRRNLDASQRSMVAAKMLGPLEEEARKRMAAGGAKSAPGKPVPTGTPFPPASSQRAAEEAAVLVGASPRSVGRAKRVLDADPELAEEVAAGEVKVTAAEKKVRESSNVGLATKPDKNGRPQPAKPLDLSKERNRQRAEKQLERLWKLLAALDGARIGLGDFNVGHALAAASDEDAKEMDRTLADCGKAFRKLRSDIQTLKGL